jgi:hypothetical protein
VTSKRSFLLFALLLVACGTATFVVQQYAGEPLHPERISVLRVNGGTDVVVVSLDGEELNYSQPDSAARVHIEMLPGVHEIDVGDLSDPLRRVVSVRFAAEPGKVYRLTLDRMAAGASFRPWKAVVWEVDRSSDRALVAVPLLPEPTAAAPAATGSSEPLPAPAASSEAVVPFPSVAPHPTSGATAPAVSVSPPAPTGSVGSASPGAL